MINKLKLSDHMITSVSHFYPQTSSRQKHRIHVVKHGSGGIMILQPLTLVMQTDFPEDQRAEMNRK